MSNHVTLNGHKDQCFWYTSSLQPVEPATHNQKKRQQVQFTHLQLTWLDMGRTTTHMWRRTQTHMKLNHAYVAISFALFFCLLLSPLQVPERFLEVAEITLREFYAAVSLGKDSDPSWKKPIYKVICKLDSSVPEEFKSHYPDWTKWPITQPPNALSLLPREQGHVWWLPELLWRSFVNMNVILNLFFATYIHHLAQIKIKCDIVV